MPTCSISLRTPRSVALFHVFYLSPPLLLSSFHSTPVCVKNKKNKLEECSSHVWYRNWFCNFIVCSGVWKVFDWIIWHRLHTREVRTMRKLRLFISFVLNDKGVWAKGFIFMSCCIAASVWGNDESAKDLTACNHRQCMKQQRKCICICMYIYMPTYIHMLSCVVHT